MAKDSPVRRGENVKINREEGCRDERARRVYDIQRAFRESYIWQSSLPLIEQEICKQQ